MEIPSWEQDTNSGEEPMPMPKPKPKPRPKPKSKPESKPEPKPEPEPEADDEAETEPPEKTPKNPAAKKPAHAEASEEAAAPAPAKQQRAAPVPLIFTPKEMGSEFQPPAYVMLSRPRIKDPETKRVIPPVKVVDVKMSTVWERPKAADPVPGKRKSTKVGSAMSVADAKESKVTSEQVCRGVVEDTKEEVMWLHVLGPDGRCGGGLCPLQGARASCARALAALER
jgi:hypothetical protein